MSDWLLRLTPDEALALRGELQAVIERYRRETPETVAQAPEGAEQVSLIINTLPDLDATADSSDAENPAMETS
jgi:hypothetical protein